MPKVLIPTKLDKAAAQLLKDNNYEVVQDAATPLADLCKANSDAQVLIVRSEAVTAEIIDLLPKLALVVRAGAGYNTIDIKYARKRNVDVMNTPGANSNGVAEEVIALILAGFRKVVPADISTRKGDWEKSKFMGRELTGKTVGILGLGHIGQLLVKRLAGFEVKVLGFDPVMSEAMAEKIGVKLCSVAEIFAESDIISLHIPENNETRGMINAGLLNTMKDGAMLVNCARAGIINEDDLRAVKAEKNLIFCNDVYPKDAAGEKSVADIADVMLPHLGANTFEANYTAAIRSAEQTIAYFEHGITSAVVNKALPDGLDAKYQQLAYALTALGKAYLQNGKVVRVETSFYGDLAQFSKWMTPPIAAALAGDSAADFASGDAKVVFEANGIELVNREVDNDKKYGQSMTIDLLATENDQIKKVSVRGTVTENTMIISRINDYEHIYFDPNGQHLLVEYQDAPGVIAKIATILSNAGINITDIRAPQDLNNGTSMTVITANKAISDDIVAEVKQATCANNAFAFNYIKQF